MAVTGLGTDSPSPRTLLLTASPAFEEEEKTDYGADDEDDGYEVDNSFDYFPTANGSSEDERKEDREEQSVKKDVENGEDESMEASVVEKIEVERHTLIEDTTVVKEYAQIEKEDDTSKQSDELLAVTVTTSSAVIDQETSSTLVSTGRATIPCDDAKDSSEDDDVDVDDPGDLRFSSDDEESDNDEVEESKMVKKKSTTNEEEQVVLGEADPIAQSPSKGIKAADSENDRGWPVVQLHPKLSGVRHSTGSHVLEPVSIAKARDLENCPLRFPAPRSVAEHYITPLAKELGLMYAMARHTAKIVSCPLEDTVLDWQFHRSETVVFQLSGRSMWRLKKSQVEYPVECFHPDSWQIGDVAQIAKVHRLSSMNHSNTGFLAPPGDDIDVFDENVNVAGVSDEPEENLLKSGSVLYIPAGVWFETKTLGVNTLWLEVQLGSFTYEELVFSAVKQLVLSDKQCRMRVQLYSGNRHQIKQARHHAEACIQSLRKEMAELDGSDVLPEYLATEDMQELVAQGLIQVTNKSSNSTSIAVDLTNPRFKLKHSKIFRDAAYRVNPVAVLMRAEEIPYLPAQRSESPSSEGTTPANTSQTQHRALKKTPKPKPKRQQTLRTISHTDKHTYILDENFGNDKRESQLHVMFQCSAEQSKLVKWLRSRGSEPFDLLEFSRGDASVVHQGKGPARCDENARSMLRFLYFVGYVTQVKA
ncbi:L-type lectin-domain containing receptor kinase VII.1 [Phytophthora nicotianae]|uniref:L-type lectin-domain containing receptor kinase VII.1 n=1 Tax=Phytophthora nicotianae TaxID=4792 RepID=A0A0W8D9Q0_PHYNI|nr:L-type lectin-domain containing receptor kinase VII.1 [Phytophthora nicotianae]